MGSCTSATRKKGNNNKVIVSNTLKSKNPNVNQNNPEKDINSIPNSLSIIINEITNEKNSEYKNNTQVSILQNTTFKELFIQLHINIYNDYDLVLI